MPRRRRRDVFDEQQSDDCALWILVDFSDEQTNRRDGHGDGDEVSEAWSWVSEEM